MARVPVTVNPDTSSCDPPTAYADQGKPTIFMFTLANSGQWNWQGTSPVVVPTGQAQFAASFIHPNGNKVVLFDKNTDGTGAPTDPTKYKYSVTVVNKTTGEQRVIDPFIQNQ